VALRDIALKKPDGDMKGVKDELAAMRADKEREMRARRGEYESAHGRLADDNRRLAAELTEMRSAMSGRMLPGPGPGVGAGAAATAAAAAAAAAAGGAGGTRGVGGYGALPPGWERHVVAPPFGATVVPMHASGRPPK